MDRRWLGSDCERFVDLRRVVVGKGSRHYPTGVVICVVAAFLQGRQLRQHHCSGQISSKRARRPGDAGG